MTTYVGAQHAWNARSIKVRRALCGRVIDDSDPRLRQLDVERVIDARFTGVCHRNGKADVAELVRCGRAAYATGAGRLAVVVDAVAPEVEVRRDAGPVDVQTQVVIDVLQMPEGRRTVLAAAADTEVRPGAVEEDEAAASHKVAVLGQYGAAREEQRQHAQFNRNTYPKLTHYYSSIRRADTPRGALVLLKKVAHGFAAELLNTRDRRRDDYIRDAAHGDVESIHDDAGR